MSTALEVDEGLGENFEETPWVPPTVKRVRRPMASEKYQCFCSFAARIVYNPCNRQRATGLPQIRVDTVMVLAHQIVRALDRKTYSTRRFRQSHNHRSHDDTPYQPRS